jgi:23S rRNA pseudouridine1911/1915/1917 synthase
VIILQENDELLVVNKPADLVCHPTKTDLTSSLIGRVRLHLGPQAHPQMVNRLDRETSGIVMIAKTPTAARELRQIWEGRQVEKLYLAIVCGVPRPSEGVVEAPLGKDLASPVAIKDCVRPDGASSSTRYSTLGSFDRDGRTFSLLQVSPQTGRKHQIRIHLKHLGHSIVGDKLYGDDERYYLDLVSGRLTEAQRQSLILRNHALHAASLRFCWRGAQVVYSAEPELEFLEFLPASLRSDLYFCRPICESVAT